MAVAFPFEKERSSLFRWVYRPYAVVSFWSSVRKNWLEIAMIVDSGADYTLLPKQYITQLGVNVKEDARDLSSRGIGGSSRVSLVKRKHRVKIGSWERHISLGFIEHNDVPPLLGRQDFMETFKVTFHKHVTVFDMP